ncbi:Hypothetical_protein [Hexamita inflata]|uniref:Hypothetical_protein n=1 Tax=Hexamita inflata TaxID=28002 RepID=A0AA86TPR5_9EUKA|nr:Hypothetical protein HINF_LOCUS11731 [Hexamita inflata]
MTMTNICQIRGLQYLQKQNIFKKLLQLQHYLHNQEQEDDVGPILNKGSLQLEFQPINHVIYYIGYINKQFCFRLKLYDENIQCNQRSMVEHAYICTHINIKLQVILYVDFKSLHQKWCSFISSYYNVLTLVINKSYNLVQIMEI